MEDRFFNQTIDFFKEFEEVDAIVLGGSRASGRHDTASDYDVYVYLNEDLSIEKRKSILSKTCKYLEINNGYWETEDDCILKNDICIEIIYRSIESITQSLSNTLERHAASAGYTTCICYNVLNSKVLYDPKKLYDGIIKRFAIPYPEPLRKAIVAKNRELLDGRIPSYLGQIEKALERNDIISINHRLAEFIKSYFDILFALNRVFHPGEKRLIELGASLCKWLPENFETDFYMLLSIDENIKVLSVLRKLITNLDCLIDKHI